TSMVGMVSVLLCSKIDSCLTNVAVGTGRRACPKGQVVSCLSDGRTDLRPCTARSAPAAAAPALGPGHPPGAGRRWLRRRPPIACKRVYVRSRGGHPGQRADAAGARAE